MAGACPLDKGHIMERYFLAGKLRRKARDFHAPALGRDVAPLGHSLGATGFARGAPRAKLTLSTFITSDNIFWKRKGMARLYQCNINEDEGDGRI
jgi:hypothetical protein